MLIFANNTINLRNIASLEKFNKKDTFKYERYSSRAILRHFGLRNPLKICTHPPAESKTNISTNSFSGLMADFQSFLH